MRCPFDSEPSGASQQRVEPELARTTPDPAVHRSAEEAGHVVEQPADALRRPGRDRVGQVEEQFRTFARTSAVARAVQSPPSSIGQHAAEAFEQRRLAGAVGTDEPEHLARMDRERHAGERGHASVLLREIADVEERLARDARLRERCSCRQGPNLPGPKRYYQ